jgi:hypothetical protein
VPALAVGKSTIVCGASKWCKTTSTTLVLSSFAQNRPRVELSPPPTGSIVVGQASIESLPSCCKNYTIMLSNFDGITRPNFDVLRQASSGALDKAKLMVGLKSEQQDAESQQPPAERTMLEEVGDLICPDLTFQQVW